MRLRKFWMMLLVLGLFTGLASFGACVPQPPPDNGGGGGGGGGGDDDDSATGSPTGSAVPSGIDEPTPSPGATLPNFDASDGTPNFIADVKGFVSSGGCSCHAGGSGGYKLRQNPSTPAQDYNNYLNTICCPRLYTYDDPVGNPGRFLTKFCNGPGSPSGGHEGRSASGAQCTTWYNWVGTGAGGSPKNCFGTAEPNCPEQM